MLTPDEALYALLCKYLLKEADSNEQQWVNTWLQANPEHPVLLASLDRLLRTAPEQVVQGAMDTASAWRVLSSRIAEREGSGVVGERGVGGRMGEDEMRGSIDGDDMSGRMGGDKVSGSTGGDKVSGRMGGDKVSGSMDGDKISGRIGEIGMTDKTGARGIRRYSRWLAAASILLLLGVGTWYLTHQKKRQINYNGAQLVILEDGTSIQLDHAAQLQVLSGFGKQNRKVILKGKAEFDVTTDAAHPFIIDLGNQVITVLGTRFSVDNMQQLRVFIHSGKIKVTRQQDSVILTAGMLLEEDTSRQRYQVGAHIMDAATHAVVFKDTPLREVLQTIHVLYHVNVTADTELLELPVTATYTGESVQNVLESIAYLSNANVINNGADYELRKQE